MEQKNTHIMYGFIMGAAMVLCQLIIHLSGATFVKGMGYVSYVPFLVGIIMNGLAFSKANEGFVTFKSAYGSCFRATLIVSLCMIAWAVVSMLVFPNMKDLAIEAARSEMAKNPKMTDDQIDTALGITKKFWNVIMISAAIFGTLFYGAIFSLVGAGVAPKKGERPIADNF